MYVKRIFDERRRASHCFSSVPLPPLLLPVSVLSDWFNELSLFNKRAYRRCSLRRAQKDGHRAVEFDSSAALDNERRFDPEEERF